MTAVFITSTGTEIGKTFVTAGLVRHLRREGQLVEALKPVVSDFDMAAAETSDPGVLLGALGRPVTAEEIARIAPWRFRAPLSPDMAARREGRIIDFGAVVAFSRQAVAANDGVLLIEGVGGIMVPLDDRHTVLDWMVELRLPVILVAGSYLGTISHSLSALDVLGRRHLKVAVLVFSETAGSSVALDETIDTVARFVPGIEIVGVPRLPSPTAEHGVFRRLADLLGIGRVGSQGR